MRKIRLLGLAFLGFIVTVFGTFFAPGTWLNRAVAISLCTVLGADSTLCAAKLAESSNRVMAATPPAIEQLIADRSTEFDDTPNAPPANNPQAPPFPQDPGPNIIRPDFDFNQTTHSQFANIPFVGTWILALYDSSSSREPSYANLLNVSYDGTNYEFSLCESRCSSYDFEYVSSTPSFEYSSLTTSNEAFNFEILSDSGRNIFLGKVLYRSTRQPFYFTLSKIVVRDSDTKKRNSKEYEVIHARDNNNSIFSSKQSGFKNNSLLLAWGYWRPIWGHDPSSDDIKQFGQNIDKVDKTKIVDYQYIRTTPPDTDRFERSPNIDPDPTLSRQTNRTNPWDSNRNRLDNNTNSSPTLPQQTNRTNPNSNSSNDRFSQTDDSTGRRNQQQQHSQERESQESGNRFLNDVQQSENTIQQGQTLIDWIQKNAGKFFDEIFKPLIDSLFKNINKPAISGAASVGNTGVTQNIQTANAIAPIFQQRSGQFAQGSSNGEPHLVTFDGYRYNFQAVGEFILMKSVSGDFEVQTRQSPIIGRDVSFNSAVAMRVGNNKVAFYSKFFPDSDKTNPLRVNGKPATISGGVLELPGGGKIYQSGSSNYLVELPTGERVAISGGEFSGSQYINVMPQVYNSPGGQFMGLLGDLDGNPGNDMKTRSGNVIPSQSTYGEIKNVVTQIVPIPGIIPLGQIENIVFDQIYKDFGNSWRVSPQESLFDYAPGQTTETFTDTNFPNQYKTLNMLNAQQIQQAEQQCIAAGVQPDFLDGCIFDVGFTGDAGFAQAAANAFQVLDSFQRLIPGGLPIPRPPISIPGLPF